ncbi:heptaprenylglyceryl phosphate synthase [Thermoactinomyces mirandus]|uniref:Heptaprenylglyceryl phosphate synthase n=1 Tax=Thermoactinomyces mirandus TaxID=2756294 RepID=A0A7W1XTS1_9BACL|nr:heptaprenylglyceryl phosphate synthase [Thermoactinomyces mirandus]MBA4603056.1 heptaprenylglyceryl phosphate synthase [Thermoactinomyces mirandus]
MLEQMAAGWRHVFKLDPNRRLSDLSLEKVCQSGTDAIIVGGTDGITFEDIWKLQKRLRKYLLPCVLEVSDINAIVPGFDGYLIPSVLNTDQARWIHGAHLKAIQRYGCGIPWKQLLLLGYVILNPESKVSRLTEANAGLDEEAAASYACLVEHLFKWPVLYVEYSGKFGDENMVRAIRRQLKKTRLFYGGGITTRRQAETMAKWADTVVVGNLVYTNVEKAVQTVSWVKETNLQEKG